MIKFSFIQQLIIIMDHIDNLAKALELENFTQNKYISLAADKTK